MSEPAKLHYPYTLVTGYSSYTLHMFFVFSSTTPYMPFRHSSFALMWLFLDNRTLFVGSSSALIILLLMFVVDWRTGGGLE